MPVVPYGWSQISCSCYFNTDLSTPHGNFPDEPRLDGVTALGACVKEILEVRTRVGVSTRSCSCLCVDASVCVCTLGILLLREMRIHNNTHTHRWEWKDGDCESKQKRGRERERENNLMLCYPCKNLTNHLRD